MEEQNGFLGQGWTFPLRFFRDSGTVEMSADEKDVREAILILLQTRLRERVLRPNYGANPEDLLFENLSITRARLMLDDIETAFTLYEPRIELVNTDLTPRLDEGMIQIELEYRILSTNSKYNLVYPFYINESPVNS